MAETYDRADVSKTRSFNAYRTKGRRWKLGDTGLEQAIADGEVYLIPVEDIKFVEKVDG